MYHFLFYAFFTQINVTILQVSIVEEVISFSALDNIKDLTCVSLFSLCFDNINAKFHLDMQAHEVLQKFQRPVVQTSSKKGTVKIVVWSLIIFILDNVEVII